MPELELEDDVQLDVEEVQADDLLSDDVEEEKDATPKRTRKVFHENNEYYFDDADNAKKAIDDKKIIYSDNSAVTGLRVFSARTGVTLDKDGNETDAGETKFYVVARSKHYACELITDRLGYTVDLTFKKAQRGRARTKIEPTILMFGTMLEMAAKAGNLNEAQTIEWNKFKPGGEYGHYRDENGEWKEAN